MRKLTLILAVLALSALPMMAQSNYHYNENMNCSDCHSMHASAHNNLTDGSAITDPNTTPGTVINPYYPTPNPGPGHHALLKAADVCATCHDGKTWAPDVIGDNVNTYARSAGGTREGTTGGGHKIGSTLGAPGYDGTNVGNYFPAGTTLECASCHSPHGGAGFRNLVPYAMRGAVGAANAAFVTPTVAKAAAFDATRDVTILDGNTYTFGQGAAAMATYYGKNKTVYSRNAAGITFNGSTSSNRMDQFCGVCHGAFHGGLIGDQVGDGVDFVRHPTSVVTMADAAHGAPNTTFNANAQANIKVFQVAATPSNTLDSPGCISCHKAHGSNNPFGLIYPNRTIVDPSEDGAGNYKDLCKSCHSMGGV
jgi:predicted CXXCH cytochrome family protein